MTKHETYMRRAIELAWHGIGRASPNPMVGCVIVRDGEIVGEGFHIYQNVDHAETLALRKAGKLAKGATAYVSLEPCCHTGRTPPCTDALINAGISKVAYGLQDPDPRVCGNGHKILEDAGIEVIRGVLADEVREQNKFFITAKEKGRPYILLKWAMTIDGKIATVSGDSKWISNESSRNITHHLRNIYDAVLVGHSTILIDNPSLTCRVDLSKQLPREIFPAFPGDIRNPVRVIIDALGSTCASGTCEVFENPGVTIVAVEPESVWEDTRARDSIDTEKIELVECPLLHGHIDLSCLMTELKSRGILSVMVEGGSSIHAGFLEAGLVDEVAIFIAPAIFGGSSAPSPVAGHGVESVNDAWLLDSVRHIKIENDLLIMGKITSKISDKEEN